MPEPQSCLQPSRLMSEVREDFDMPETLPLNKYC